MNKVTTKTRAGKNGRDIICPKCQREINVGHFSWSSLKCTGCSEMIKKLEWLLKESPAATLGKKGGQVKSEAKTRAARKNASKPRGKWATAVAYEYKSTTGETRVGVLILRGKTPKNEDEFWAWAEKQVGQDIGNAKHPISEILRFSTRSMLI